MARKEGVPSHKSDCSSDHSSFGDATCSHVISSTAESSFVSSGLDTVPRNLHLGALCKGVVRILGSGGETEHAE